MARDSFAQGRVTDGGGLEAVGEEAGRLTEEWACGSKLGLTDLSPNFCVSLWEEVLGEVKGIDAIASRLT